MDKRSIKKARTQFQHPLYRREDVNALDTFMNRLSLDAKQRMFPKEFLYKLLNINMTNRQKIAALGSLMNIKSKNGKLYLSDAIRQKIFGKMTSYSNKSTTRQSRHQYYQTKLGSTSKKDRNQLFINVANKAKEYISNSILYGYSNDYIKILKEDNKLIDNNATKILKTGYLNMEELEKLKELHEKSKRSIKYYKRRIRLSTNSDDLKQVEKDFIKNRMNLFEVLWQLIVTLEYKVRVLYLDIEVKSNNNTLMIPHNNINSNNGIRNYIQNYLIQYAETEDSIYGHPDQSPDWHILFFYLFDEKYIRRYILESYKDYGVLENTTNNMFRNNLPWKKHNSFLKSFTFYTENLKKNEENTLIKMFRHYFKYLTTKTIYTRA